MKRSTVLLRTWKTLLRTPNQQSSPLRFEQGKAPFRTVNREAQGLSCHSLSFRYRQVLKSRLPVLYVVIKKGTARFIHRSKPACSTGQLCSANTSLLEQNVAYPLSHQGSRKARSANCRLRYLRKMYPKHCSCGGSAYTLCHSLSADRACGRS
jgi:hypothetical protein